MSIHPFWQRFRPYLSPSRPGIALLAGLLSVGIGLQIYSPLVLRSFIDAARSDGPTGRIHILALLFMSTTLGSQVVAVWAAYVSQRVSWETTNRLRSALVRHTLTRDISFFKHHTPGVLIERVDGDVSALGNLFSQFAVVVLANGLLLAGVLTVLFMVDWRAGTAVTLFVLISFYTLNRVRNIATPYWQETRRLSAEYVGFLGERLSGREEIRANGTVAHVMQRFFEQMGRRAAAEGRAGKATAVMLIATFGLLALGMSLSFLVGAALVTAGAISVGTAFMIFFYTEQLRRPIEQISSQVQELGRAAASIGRVSELLETPSSLSEGRVALEGGPLSVEFCDVTFGYEPDQTVLYGVSFRLEPGMVMGMVGRTGSGKSTVGRLLAHLYDPNAGCIRVGGMNVREVLTASLRTHVAVVSQDVQIFQGTLRENLRLFDESVSDERMLTALREFGMWEWYRRLPDGLDTAMQTGGTGHSAGEVQLVAFARAFLKEPGLVILDEASSRLDPGTERRIEVALDRLLQGRTAILVAHRLATVSRADRIIVMEAGRVAEEGNRTELVANPHSHFYRLLTTGWEETTACLPE